jgi:hypothetical protein
MPADAQALDRASVDALRIDTLRIDTDACTVAQTADRITAATPMFWS